MLAIRVYLNAADSNCVPHVDDDERTNDIWNLDFTLARPASVATPPSVPAPVPGGRHMSLTGTRFALKRDPPCDPNPARLRMRNFPPPKAPPPSALSAGFLPFFRCFLNCGSRIAKSIKSCGTSWFACSMFRTSSPAKCVSDKSTSVCAVPLVPARPVRPIRCVCVSMSRATSKLTTVRTAGMSSPRDATSVARSSLLFPRLKSAITPDREFWSMSPCSSSSSGCPCFLRFSASSWTLAFLVTKTRTEPAEKNSTSRCVNHVHLFIPSWITCAFCVTSWLASPISPTTTRMGSSRTSRASFSTRFLNVALKRSV
eukprot:m.588589 g.588589  ORF g.588589 m.588589 type:complete len:314 (-) comp22365_c0_seq16:1607-2548(-)